MKSARSSSRGMVAAILALFCCTLASAQEAPIVVITRHAPQINGDGRVEGSVQMLLGENTVLNGGAVVTGDLHVPGTPAVQINGSPTFSGVVEGAGSLLPSNYAITLNTGASLQFLRTRAIAAPLPTVEAPQAPNGTAKVTVNNPAGIPANWNTVRDLTLNGGAGTVSLPPGAYRNVTANGQTALRVGVPNATTPAAYHIQALTLNGQARLIVDGPVVLTLNQGLNLNGETGVAAHPEWLQLRLANGGVNLNAGATAHALILSPAGTVIVNGGAAFYGTVACDRLRLNGNGLICWQGAGSSGGNRAPVANQASIETDEDTPKDILLSGSDPDGDPITYAIVNGPSRGTITQVGALCQYRPAQNYSGADSFTFKVSDGSESSGVATVSINVLPRNDAPEPRDSAELVMEDTPTIIRLTATDVEGDALTFSVPAATAHGALEKYTGPNAAPGDFLYTPAPNNTLPDSFAFTVTDASGASAQGTVHITMTPVEDFPVATALDRSVLEDGELSLTLSGLDGDGQELTFELINEPVHGSLTEIAQVFTYRPNANFNGTDQFQYVARDSAGNVSQPATVTLRVIPVDDAPVVENGVLDAQEDAPLNFAFEERDVDGEDLHYVILQGPAHGTLAGAGAMFVYTPAPNFHGEDAIVFVAVDSADPTALTSASATLQFHVASQNDAPVAQPAAVTTSEDDFVTITLSATDVDGDALTYTAPRPSEGAQTFSPARGSLAATEDPRIWIYTPAADYSGEDRFSFRVTDPDGATADAEVMITVTPKNDYPTVSPFAVSVNEDETVGITLTGSDVDDSELFFFIADLPHHGSLSGTAPNFVYEPSANFDEVDTFTYYAVDAWGFASTPATVTIAVTPQNDAPVAQVPLVVTDEDTAVTITLSATDAESDPVTYQISALPTFGTLAVIAPGEYRYTPGANFQGTDTFTFTAFDGQSHSAPTPVVITVNPRNDAPVAELATVSTSEDRAISIQLAASDVDGDTLTFLDPTAPHSGTLQRDPLDASRFIYTPAENFNGTDSFQFVARDGELSSAPATIAIIVVPVNDAPTADAGADITITAPALLSLQGSAQDDAHPGTNPLTYTWSRVSGPGAVAFGNANSAQTTASYTQAGTYVLRLTVSDGDLSGTDDVQVSIAMPNRPPAVNAGADLRVAEGAAAALAGNVTDDGMPNGATVSSAWTKFSGPGLVTFANAAAPATTASFTAPGEYVLRLRASDTEYTAQDHVTVLVEPANLAPVVDAGMDRGGVVADEFTLGGSVTDDGKPRGAATIAAWSVVSGPGSVTFADPSAPTTRARFSAPGTYVLRLAATDTVASALDEVTITVSLPPNTAPVVNAGSDQTLNSFRVAQLNGSAQDDGQPSPLSYQWTQVSGPAAAQFEQTNAASANVDFTTAGSYIFRLTVSDGELSSSDEVTVNVALTNGAPVVRAGFDQSVSQGGTITLSGEVTDDGLPAGNAVSLAWTKVSGPGTVTFGSNSARTTATFSAVGDYVLRLTANDSQLTASDDVNVSVVCTPLPAPSGMVGLWRGNDNTRDALGFREATTPKGIAYSDGKSGRAFLFDGVDDHLFLSRNATLPSGAPSLNVGNGSGLTVEMWIKPSTLTSHRPLLEWDAGGPGVYFWASYNGGGRLFASVTDTNGGSRPATATTPLTLNEWQHVALTYDKATSTVRLFRNGINVGQSVFTAFTPSTIGDVYVGTEGPYGRYCYAGGMDEVTIYNRALTQAELLSIFQVGACGKTSGLPDGYPSLIVEAGNDLSVPYLHSAKLSAVLRDVRSSSPGALSLQWSKVSGPGAVQFSSQRTLATAVQFDAPGTYVLRLEATDGETTASDSVVVEVTADSYVHKINLQSGNGTSRDPLNRFTTNNGATWQPAFFTTHPDYALLTDTAWIIGSTTTSVSKMRARFVLPANFSNPSLNLFAHFDNALKVRLNGTQIASLSFSTDSNGQEVVVNDLNTFRNPPEVISTNNAALFLPGENYLEFEVHNTFGPTGVDYQGYVSFTAGTQTGNNPPQLNAGPDLTIALPGTATLAATTSGDFLPLPDLTMLFWQKLSGPGSVSFSDPTVTNPTVTFSTAGEYQLQISANDGEFTVYDTLTVTVLPPVSGTNQPPAVAAGPDFGGATLARFSLSGLVVDDGKLLAAPRLQWSKVSGPGTATFSTPTAAVTDAVVSQPGEYVFSLTADDGSFTVSDTVTFYAGFTTYENQAPVAQAGPDRTVQLPNAQIELNGAVADDAFPFDWPRTGRWEIITQGASAELTDADQLAARARFSEPGDYIFRLSVTDGIASASDEMIVHVLPAPVADPLNTAPSVAAGGDLNLPGLGPVTLSGTVTDDGRPSGQLSINWIKVSGPGAVQFANPGAPVTEVLFNAPGTYLLRLTASDGLLAASDDVLITAGAGGNQPPVVIAGPDQRVPFGAPAILTPTITDDGLPNGVLSAQWSVVSGPGAVQLDGSLDALAVNFARLGTYTLRLTVSDGEKSGTDEITINVAGDHLSLPSVVITAPVNGATFTHGLSVPLSAQVEQTSRGISFVDFYDGSSWIGRDDSAPYEVSWTPLAAGERSVTAVATDSIGLAGTSLPVNVTVASPIPVVTLVQPPSGAAFAPGETVTLQASATVYPGGAAIQQVEFLANGAPIGSDTTAPYSVSWTLPAGFGDYALTARALDASGQVINSEPVGVHSVADPNAEPIVWIGNLLGGETITAPRTITGTVEHPSLKDYRLEYRRKGAVCTNWVTFASGTSAVHNGTLGTFDPTVLLNGLYDVRLVARSAYGAEITDEVSVAVEGGMKVGLFTLAFNDLELPLAGMPITVTRIYDSREHCPGDFGHGWKLDVESIRLDWNAPIGSGWNLDITDGTLTQPPIYTMQDDVSHMATVRMPDGEVLRFSPKVVFAREYNRLASVLDGDGDDIAQAWIPLGNSTPLRVIYRARGGTQGATLLAHGYKAAGLSGTATAGGDATFYPGDPYGGELLLATDDNTTLDAPIVSDVTGWELRLKDNRVFLFDDKGRLEQMTDANGNTLAIIRDGAGRVQQVTHSSGKQITFVRDPKGFVTEIADPKGAKLHYAYDSAGDLRGFYDRATPLTSTNPTQSFTYKAGTHYLEDLFDGKGVRASRSYYDTQGRLTRTVDADGKEVVLTHNVAGRTETIRDRTNRVTTHRYDERGNVVETVSPDGTVQQTSYHVWSDGRKSELKTSESITGLFADNNGALVQKTVTTRYAYEDEDPSTPPANDGLLRKVTDPLGHSTTFTYDERGNVLTVTDALSRTTINTYHPGTSLLATTTDAEGHITSYTYDGRGQMDKETRTVTVQDETGASQVQLLVTDYDYNAAGQLTKLTDANNHATSYTYDANGNQLTSTTTRADETGAVRTLVTTQEYDDANRLVKSWDALHPKAAGYQPASETVYDENGKVAVTYDAQRRAAQMFYNARGELIRTQYADSTSESTDYDAEGRREFHTDRRGKKTQFFYDANGRLEQTWFLGSGGDTPARLSATRYDGAGRVYQSTDSRNQTTTFIYDDAGRRTATINARNERSATQYDDAGNAWKFTDAKGNTVENKYDDLNRKVRTIFAPTAIAESTNATVRMVATETVTVYDELGRRVTEVEQSPVDTAVAARRATRYIYDKLGRLSAVVQPEVDGSTPITRYTYDELGSQLTQTDALNHTTRYTYDDLGRRIGRQLPGGQSESVTYFRSGAVKERLDFNGTLTSYTYDSLNRILSRTSNHSNSAASNVSFTYTASGQRETMTDATGTTVYGYDHRDRLKTKATPQGTITYDYDDASGLLTGMHTNTPNGAVATYTYDELGRLKTVSDVNQQTTTYEYDANGNLESVLLPNGVTSTYAYSATNRLEDLGITKGGTTLAQFAYTLAPTGHRYRSAEIGSALQPASPAATRARVWQYDALWRLRNEALSGGVALGNGQAMPNGSVQYTLDAVGNRTARTSTIAGLASQNFTFDGNDRVQGDLADNNGNTLSGTVSQPASTGTNGQDTYDAENRLIARNGMVAAAPCTISIAYNGDGHKISETTTRGGVTTTITHLVDELNPTGYAQVIEEKSNGVLSRVYLFGHDLISQDVADETTGQWDLRYFGYDGHGSTRFLTNPTGAVTDTYEYDAFGELLAHTGATPNRYRYCGEQFSESLGLYYLRARLMNPLTGRFWAMDSYEGRRGDPATLHKYLYCAAEPGNMRDYSGFNSLSELQAAEADGMVATKVAAVRTGFSVGSQAGGTALGQLGIAVETEAAAVVSRIGQVLTRNKEVLSKLGGRRFIDILGKVGERIFQIESKYQIPTKVGSALTRLVAQLEGATATAAQGETVVLFAFKQPTVAVLEQMLAQLSNEAIGRVTIVVGFRSLYQFLEGLSHL